MKIKDKKFYVDFTDRSEDVYDCQMNMCVCKQCNSYFMLVSNVKFDCHVEYCFMLYMIVMLNDVCECFSYLLFSNT